jgi:hypothetical protein
LKLIKTQIKFKMRKTYLLLGLLLMLIGASKTSLGQVTQTFTYTGGKQTFVVPSCVSQLTITCYGAQGANGHDSLEAYGRKLSPGGTGGLGAIVSGVYPATPGTVLNLFVGGAALNTTAGYNGGGIAGENAGAGGGASDVRLNDTTLESRIMVAGGGGGGGNGAHSTNTTSSLKGGDGGGGGANGTDGSNSDGGFGGLGGVASTGGVNGAGCSCCMGVAGQNGSTGIGGKGGDGEAIVSSGFFSGFFKTSGGGGGGGFFGGGGGGGGTAGTSMCALQDTGGGGGGAGGTNYINPSFTATATTNAAAPAGNGKIVITYTVVTLPTASFTINNNNQCQSGNNFEFTNTSTNATSYLWDFGDGTTGTSPSHSYTSSGTYDVKLVASNVTGCKDSITSSVTVKHVSASVATKTACESYTWIDGNTYTSSNNTATYTLTNAVGCDSVVTLNLTINHSNAGTDVQTACSSYTWIDGVTYTSNNNTATHTVTNAAGCDSVVTLNLTINSNTGTDVQTACDSYTWIDGNTYTSSNNAATHTLTNALGCDSVVTLNLTINHSTSGTDVQTACESYTWIDGITYTTSNNSATDTLTNALGCDSVVTLNLTIINVPVGVTLSGATLTANTGGLAYQWLDCDNNFAPVNGQISESFTAITNGSYAVKITEGQCADTSDCVNVTTVNIAQNESGNFVAVYPNPFLNELSIETNGKSIRFEIYNALGQLIDKGVVAGKTIVQTATFESGVYTIKLESEKNIEFIKLIKQ